MTPRRGPRPVAFVRLLGSALSYLALPRRDRQGAFFAVGDPHPVFSAHKIDLGDNNEARRAIAARGGK